MASTVRNRTLIFKRVPKGMPVPGQDLAVEDRPIDVDSAPKGGLVVEILYVSFDPYLRGRMRESDQKSYSAAFELDSPILEDSVARVIKTDRDDFREGDLVISHLPVAEYARIPANHPQARMLPGVRKVENPYGLELAHFIGVLGMPGLTAYSGLHRIGKPQRGETIFVSSAAGAVGQLVGQIAKQEGLRVIGSVGSDEKLHFILNELGFDGGFNYKKEKVAEALRRLAPTGVDIYFENVGGEHLEAALDNMNLGGRIPVCGMVSRRTGSSCPPCARTRDERTSSRG